MSAGVPPPPFAAQRATCWLWAETRRGLIRLYVRFAAPERADFALLRSSFRAHFPRHGQALYNPRRRCWSLPAAQVGALDTWLALHLAPDAVRLDAPPDLARPLPAPPARA